MGLFDIFKATPPTTRTIVASDGPAPLDVFWCEGEEYTIAKVDAVGFSAVTYVQIGEARKRKVVSGNTPDLVKRDGKWTLPGREGPMKPPSARMLL